MRDRILLVGALLLLLGLGLYQSGLLTRIDAREGPINEPVTLEGTVQTEPDYSDDWWYLAENGQKAHKVVNSWIREGETEQQAETRHNAKVARLQEAFPPVTPP